MLSERGEVYDEDAAIVCFDDRERPAPLLWVYAIFNIEHAAYMLHTVACTYNVLSAS